MEVVTWSRIDVYAAGERKIKIWLTGLKEAVLMVDNKNAWREFVWELLNNY